MIAGVDHGERLRKRIDRADPQRPPAPARLPRDREDEEEAEKGVTGMERRNRGVRVRVDQPRDGDRVITVRTGGVGRRDVGDPDQARQKALLTGRPGRGRRKEEEGQCADERERDHGRREAVEERSSLDPE